MPRDGSNVYHRPSGIDAVTNTTISSTAYNLNVQDVEIDLNTPRPIVAGGTGANNATQAIQNLGGELAKQAVTNYDAQVFQAGSFYSTTSATGAPVAGHAFSGICYVTDANNMFIQARDQDDTTQPGLMWTRQMKGGVWSAWAADAGSKAVRYDIPQGLTGADVVGTPSQTTQGRQNIYAAPFDAMSYSGMQMNGSCDISQERGSTTFTLANNTPTYAQDGWKPNVNSATVTVAASPLNPLGNVAGFQNSLKLTATTGSATVAAGDFFTISHFIEGYRVARLNFGASGFQPVQPVTIAFWVYTTIAGTMTVALRNAAGDRTYITEVSSSAATWQYKTITIPGDTLTSAVWEKTNNAGFNITFCFGSGTTRQGTAGSWLGANTFATAAITNFFATTNNIAAITGLVVLPGIEAPSAARSALIMRPYDQELLTCQRYYQKSYPIGTNAPTASIGSGLTARFSSTSFPAGGVYGSVDLKTRMRANPSITIYSYASAVSRVTDGGGTDLAANSGVAGNVSDASFTVSNNSGGAVSAVNQYVQFHWTADARL